MPRKKKVEERVPLLDERFSLDSYEGILGSLRIVAEGIADESLKRDKADLLLKVLSSARMTITEKRKTSVLDNKAVSPDPIAGASVKVNSSGPFAVYSTSDKQ
tara:strand:- start:468 stop:776 length:309 start_codon:yes stop_codon:yes gene_type:complete